MLSGVVLVFQDQRFHLTPK